MAGSLDGRVALVTGASRGLGAAAARALAAEGAHVIMVARTVGGLEEIDDLIGEAGGSATLVPLDLREGERIDGLAAPLLERWGRLDILVGNAGMLGQVSPLAQIEPKAWADTFALNVTANWRLVRALDPLLRRSDGARAVFVTSGITRSLPAYWGAYAASKAALEAMVTSYARELENTPHRVNLLNPGPTRTALRAQAFPGEDATALPGPEHVARSLLPLLQPGFEGNGLWIAGDTPLAATETRH